MFSVPTEVPTDWSDIALIPVIAVFFGLLAYFIGEFGQAVRGGKVWKGIGMGVLALGCLTGFRYFLAMVSGSFEAVAYRESMFSRKLFIAHWAAFFLPVACLILAIVITVVRKKRASVMYDEF